MSIGMRRLLLTLALVVSLSAFGATTALGAPEAAQKTPILGQFITFACTIGAAGGGNSFGFAVLDTPGDETTLTGKVRLKGAKAQHTYEVFAVSEAYGPNLSDCAFHFGLGSFTTNNKGNGAFDFTTERFPPATKFSVLIEGGQFQGEDEFATPAVELD